MNRFLLVMFLLVAPAHAEWTPQTSGTDADLVDVCFVDELHGWAIGNDGWDPIIIATTDGGITWQQQTIPEILPEKQPHLNKIQFMNEDIGFIVGQSQGTKSLNYIFTTHNGGITWDVSYSLPQYYRLKDLFFLNESIGWAAGEVRGDSGSEEPHGGVVLLTKDGGNTWEEQLHVSFDSLDIDGFRAITFADELHGWMLGFNSFTSGDVPPTNVYYTSDGGDSWNKISQIDDARGAHSLYIVNHDTLWTSQAMHLSVDGGLTWSDLPYTADISLIDGTSGWAVTSFLDPHAMDPEFKIHYFSNVGESWSEQYDQGELWLYAVDSYGEDFACAVGEYGAILTYTNTSTTVETQSHPTAFTLDQNFPNPFNASTTITYTLKSDSPVTVKLYSSTGQLVQTLCDHYMPAGRHSVVVDGSDLASGVYVVRVQTSGAEKYTRMLLLK